jgi:hypothetical protein
VQDPGSFRGRIAGAAITLLREEGFACWLEQRTPVPMLFCSKWDPTPGLACRERRYAFEVEWSDANTVDASLMQQLRTRRIGAQRYICVPGD